MGYDKGMKCSKCDPCANQCGCPNPALAIESVPETKGVVRYNINGKRYDYDYEPLVYRTQTDTSLIVDIIKRLLIFSAERHQDSITAAELGSILHLADIGDVSTAHAETGSMLVYQKNTDCGEGCVGDRDVWKVWNALDEQVSSATYPAAFDADGKMRTIQRPQNPNQYYQLGWNAGNGLSYSQIPIVDASRVVGTDGKKIALYLDPETKQIVGVKE